MGVMDQRISKLDMRPAGSESKPADTPNGSVDAVMLAELRAWIEVLKSPHRT